MSTSPNRRGRPAGAAPPPAPGSGPAAAPPSPQRPPSPRPAAARRRRRSLLPYGMAAPAVVLELLIHIVPMALGIYIAFTSLTQLTIRRWTTAPFVGWENFAQGLDPGGALGGALYQSLLRTAGYTVLVVGLSWALGMAAAVALNSRFRGRGLVRTLFLVPYALPVYVTAIVWAFMVNQRDGMVNRLLVSDLGLLEERPFWLIGENAFWVLVVVSVWRLWPFAFLMLLAALQSIPNEVYEAAAIDGASNWKRFTSVTLPMVRSANGVVLLVMGLWTFNEFDLPYLLFGETSPESARLVSPLVYEHSFVNWNFGLGAAMSALLLAALVAASALYVRTVLPRRRS
ncbi:carbohydrate ABC transporter permease [Streptomonospora nanhaiensis]|uniref:Multiple sugar transport system permease protein n=3 Tax=Streptomonospora nanhaiensis TaxID=1323731 RepID=A0A853BLZ3_9ACTN|nr:sugar ABC transporter permease [Streptomonospora nanhaiensis]NYI96498.1 multiple sugar transport system permease protein [Streptomonospora nanhaiensis]